MSDDSTASSDKKAKPIFRPDDVVEPESAPASRDTTADQAADRADHAADKADAADKAAAKAGNADKATQKDAKSSATSGAAAGSVSASDAGASEHAGREVVYVQAPIPPRLKSNRGVGSLLAVLGAVVFAVVFAGAVTVSFALDDAKSMGDQFGDFIQNAIFWVPVLVFLVAFVLLTLVVNRAGWAAHVFGSLLVAFAVYFGSIGIMLMLGMIVGSSADASLGSFNALALNPKIVIAALVAREVSIWVGLAIAARGRRVKERNHAVVDEWEREHADTKAQYERATTT